MIDACVEFSREAESDGRDGPLPPAAVARLGTTRGRHVRYLTALALSPDSRLLATRAGDDRVRLWDAATGRELRQLAGHDGEASCVRFSPDGKLLASAGRSYYRPWHDVGAGTALTLWDLSGMQGAGEWVLLDFPGLGAAESGVRDAFLCKRDLAEGRLEIQGRRVRVRR